MKSYRRYPATDSSRTSDSRSSNHVSGEATRMSGKNDSDDKPLVKMVPISMQLNLERDDTMFTLSRGSTIYEDKIGISFVSEDTRLSSRKSTTPKDNGTKPSRRSKGASKLVNKPPTPRTDSNKDTQISTMTVKPLRKPKHIPPTASHKVQFKDARTVYSKRVKLVGKVKKRKTFGPGRPSMLKNLVARDKVKNLQSTDLFVDLNVHTLQDRDNNVVSQEKETDTGNEDGNYFKCSNIDENPYNNIGPELAESYIATHNMFDNSTLPKSVPSINKKIPDKKKLSIQKVQKKTIKTKIEAALNKAENAAKSMKTRRKATSKDNTKAAENVLTSMFVNKRFRKSKPKSSRPRRRVDLSNKTFARIPTLINWVEFTTVLHTPAMQMQSKLTDGSINRDTIANRKFNGQHVSDDVFPIPVVV